MKKIFIIILGLLFYITMSEMSAKRKAESFCDSVAVGVSGSSLLERAIESGARKSGSYWDSVASQKSLYAAFTGYYPGSDFICKIDTENGVVVAKHRSLITSLF
jgi:hypothetical protein